MKDYTKRLAKLEATSEEQDMRQYKIVTLSEHTDEELDELSQRYRLIVVDDLTHRKTLEQDV